MWYPIKVDFYGDPKVRMDTLYSKILDNMDLGSYCPKGWVVSYLPQWQAWLRYMYLSHGAPGGGCGYPFGIMLVP